MSAFPPPACAACAARGRCATWSARPTLAPSDLVLPMFVEEGLDGRTPIDSMPGIDRLGLASAVEEAGSAHALGIPAVLLFGIPAEKDDEGSGAWDDEGVVQLATRAIKAAHPDLLVHHRRVPVRVHRPRPLRRLRADGVGRQRRDARAARAHGRLARARGRRRRRAERHDGRPRRRDPRRARRRGLRRHADHRLQRQVRLRVLRPVPRGRRLHARASATAAATRWIPATRDEAVREALLDVDEGADMVMVKPALPYLDVIRRVKEATRMPVAAYNVSGEYAMIKAAAATGPSRRARPPCSRR